MCPCSPGCEQRRAGTRPIVHGADEDLLDSFFCLRQCQIDKALALVEWYALAEAEQDADHLQTASDYDSLLIKSRYGYSLSKFSCYSALNGLTPDPAGEPTGDRSDEIVQCLFTVQETFSHIRENFAVPLPSSTEQAVPGLGRDAVGSSRGDCLLPSVGDSIDTERRR